MPFLRKFAIRVDGLRLDMGLHLADCFDSFDNRVIQCGSGKLQGLFRLMELEIFRQGRKKNTRRKKLSIGIGERAAIPVLQASWRDEKAGYLSHEPQ